MTPRIEILKSKTLIGTKLSMSFQFNKTQELWKNFLPRRKEIQHQISSDLFSLQVYNNVSFFKNFDANASFDKYALIEVSQFDEIPEGMEMFVLSEGKYAVFQYKGDAKNATGFFKNIFENWLPISGYILDNRPHFEILGEKYKNNDPNSEEEVWIPIK